MSETEWAPAAGLARLRALTRLAREVAELRAALALARERVDRTKTAEALAGSRQRLPAAARVESREALWELQRLAAEMRRLRGEFDALRYGPPDYQDAAPGPPRASRR